MKTNYPKLFNEHRIAFDEIVKIERSKDSYEEKIKSIVSLFNQELLPHFREEENTILLNNNNPMALEILDEHKEAYATIDKMQKGEATAKDLDDFIQLMKNHIKKEDKYFGEQLAKPEKDSSGLIFVLAGIIILVLLFSPNWE